MPLKLLIGGGGTGGHIFPALSIANAVKRHCPDAEILFVGALGRMEMEKVPEAGYKIIGLPVAGFSRTKLWKNFGVLIKLWRSMRMARKIVKDFKPDVVVGVGGYASAPVVKRAQKSHIPTLIQEQNSYPGVTNKLLAAKACKICVAYPGMNRFFPEEKIVETGNPVRQALTECDLTKAEAKKALGFNSDTPLVVSVGGSLGAATINEAIEAALPLLAEKGINLFWQTGKIYADKAIPKAGQYVNVKAVPFVKQMDVAYRAADLVVARAGAGTISELELLGVPAILVPSPNVAEDHQRKNAMALTTRDAALMILDAEAVEKLPEAIVKTVTDKELLERLSTNVKLLAKNKADEKIARLVIELAKNNQLQK